jgi:hypothetical protein
MPMSPPNRRELMKAIEEVEARLRWAGSQLTVEGYLRYLLLQMANQLARLLERDRGG